MNKIALALRELLLARAAGMIDAEEFERRQAALHAELLAENAVKSRRHWWIAGGGAAVLALAIGVYAWKTSEQVTPESLPPMMSSSSSAPISSTMTTMPRLPSMAGNTMPPPGMGQSQSAPGANVGDLNTMAARLAEKLAKNPQNGDGWALLAQSYVELKRYHEADAAFAKADALGKVDARLREEWNKAKAAAGGK